MRRPKLSLKNLSWPVVWIVIGLLMFWASLISGCVTVYDQTNVFVIEPVVELEIEK
ncbi:hypothetical protein LCGC14_0362410 [marine sediment metagenome]|uniref:Uncharacterized protein n=1 Tax=marine sediment metagenome TaxID=412755 RepID=A0A0F9WG20_9ZZZZ